MDTDVLFFPVRAALFRLVTLLSTPHEGLPSKNVLSKMSFQELKSWIHYRL